VRVPGGALSALIARLIARVRWGRVAHRRVLELVPTDAESAFHLLVLTERSSGATVCAPCLRGLWSREASAPCSQPDHSALPLSPTNQPYHSTLPLSPTTLPYHSARPLYPTTLPDHSARSGRDHALCWLVSALPRASQPSSAPLSPPRRLSALPEPLNPSRNHSALPQLFSPPSRRFCTRRAGVLMAVLVCSCCACVQCASFREEHAALLPPHRLAAWDYVRAQQAAEQARSTSRALTRIGRGS
jgi:hypothetical protein